MNEAQPGGSAEPCPRQLLIIAGNDPSGGAGIAADLQVASAWGLHPLPVITSVTAQDTHDVRAVHALSAEQVGEQLRVLLDDLRPDAVKIGLLPTVAIAEAVADILAHLHVPVVLDPVLKAGGGGRLADDPLAQALVSAALPRATVTTPNQFELARLVPSVADDAPEPARTRAAQLAKSTGCHVLVTGADAAADARATEVINHAVFADGTDRTWRWPRLHGRYHGSGCTLAAAIACALGQGDEPDDAMDRAQRYTFDALQHAFRPSDGQSIPGRMIK